MNQKFTLSFFVLLLTASIGLSRHLLTVNNPAWGSWENNQGTIEKATFMIEPKGVYMEVGMILTLSARDTWWGAGDTLEAVLDFTLPEDAIIHDSWLWIGDEIVKADVMDIWSASAIYDDIVDRQRDPSILYEKPEGGYQIRVFPMDGDDVRKIKITYLSPVKWTNETASISIPTEILQTSLNPLQNFTVITVPNSDWGTPYIEQFPNEPWTTALDSLFGTVSGIVIEGNAIGKPLDFVCNAPLKDGIFFSKTTSNGENFYQLAYVPELQIQKTKTEKMLFVIESTDWLTDYDPNSLFGEIKNRLYTNFTPKDSFNLMYLGSNGDVLTISPTWVKADSAGIESAFTGLPSTHTGSNFTKLMEAGIEFVQSNGKDAEITFFGCSMDYSWLDWANSVLDNLMASMGNDVIPINIFDTQTYQESDFWFDPWWVDTPPNHDYLYTNLARLTGGNYYPSLRGNCSLWESLDNFFVTKSGIEGSIDIDVVPTNGFNYSDFSVRYLGQSHFVNKPYVQIGKYYGDASFQIEVASLVDGEVFFEILNLDSSQVHDADTLNREMWFGHYIWDLSGGNPSNAQVEDVIKLSIEERVLSKYTAFLALEENLGGEICFGCWEVGDDIFWPVETTEGVKDEIIVNTFPNPFTEFVNFQFEHLENGKFVDGEIKIFDSLGREVDAIQFKNQTTVTWYLNNNLNSGIYYAIIQVNDQIIKQKLVRVN